MGKKSSRSTAPSKVSAESPANSGATYTGNKSSILRAVFSPSEYQLALFASVIQGLDAQHVRIHDTTTGRLQCDHALGSKEVVTSLDWGYYAGRQKGADGPSKKKRKRSSDVNGAVPADGLDAADIVVGFGTSTSDIRMYSPAEDKIVGTLSGAHENGIKDFKFTADQLGHEGWSIGGDNRLVQWDLRTGQSVRVIDLPATSIFATLSQPVPSNPPVICASSTPYIIDVEKTDDTLKSFPAMNNLIHTIISSSQNSIDKEPFLTSDNGRYITVLDPLSDKVTPLVMNLVTEKEVSSLSLYRGSGQQAAEGAAALHIQTLAVVTDDGTVELFAKPFAQPSHPQAKGAKAKRQNMRKADASVQIVRSATSDGLVPVVTAAFQGNDLIVAWADGGVVPVFERVEWLDTKSNELAFTGTKKVVRSRTGSSTLGGVTTNGTRKAEEINVDESRAVVERGDLADDVAMEDVVRNPAHPENDIDDDYSDDEGDKKDGAIKTKTSSWTRTTGADDDVDMANAPLEPEDGPDENGDVAEDDDDEEGGEAGEPSFGDLLRAKDAEEVDVEAEMEEEARLGQLTTPGKPSAAVYQIPSGVSLSTVLTQALKTNDREMLESCFQTSDLSIVRTTIQRLDSSLAATLLQRLSERLAARPGRYGHLLIWIQWTCVAHGGALAGNPDLLSRMTTLFKVMDQRSSSLSSLLLLKGKLDMLDAQLGLRQAIRRGAEGLESDDEENVIYVEGQDEIDESDAERTRNVAVAATTPRAAKSTRVDEDVPMMNGIDDSENEEDDGGSDDEEDEDEELLDIEAEESAGSSDAEESMEDNDDDDEEDIDNDDEESMGSMVDFIADTEDDEESDIEPETPNQSRLSKKAKIGKGESKAGSRKR